MKKLILEMSEEKYQQLMQAFQHNTAAQVDADIQPTASFEVEICPPLGSDIVVRKGSEIIRIELDDLRWE